MQKKLLLLMNPYSGVGKGKEYLYDIVHTLSLGDYEVTVFPIDPKNGLEPDTFVKEKGNEFDMIVCYGGDGTLNHLVNAICIAGIDKPIGYIPGGSTNDFSKNFEDNLTVEKICENIVKGEEFAYDVGKLNNQYFNYIAAFGAFTEISYSTDQEIKNIFGHGAYVMYAIGTLGNNLSYRRHVVIEHDGIKEEGDYIYVGISNSPSVGGFRVPYSDNMKLNDGLFEVLLVSAPNSPIDFATVGGDLASERTDSKYIRTFQAKEISFSCDKSVHWTIDGEYAGEINEGTISIIPERIRIMVGKQKKSS
ncbi:MAG: YegS/Rv2252/BmrU family lipid kinase [Holdemanella sp.]|nr:YegS/Rv2252/BmrU family lipid kinase [Holdemanella sp.]